MNALLPARAIDNRPYDQNRNAVRIRRKPAVIILLPARATEGRPYLFTIHFYLLPETCRPYARGMDTVRIRRRFIIIQPLPAGHDKSCPYDHTPNCNHAKRQPPERLPFFI